MNAHDTAGKTRTIIRGAVATGVTVAVVMAWRNLQAAACSIVPILWTLAPLLLLHAVQMLLSAAAWSGLLSPAGENRVSLGVLLRLRVIREGVDCLLPVAQIGGEMIAASALVRAGMRPHFAAGGIIVDVITELLGQFGYLTLGCLLLTGTNGHAVWPICLSLACAVACALVAPGAVRRLGVLKLAERIILRLARHLPDMPALAIGGLPEAVSRIFADRAGVSLAVLLHFLHWLLGAVEVWIVLHALGLPIAPAQAIIMNAVGIAARSVGFAVPGSLIVQESGFMLGAALTGQPPQAAIVFSLVRRLRELLIGGAGLILWKFPAPRAQPVPCRNGLTSMSSGTALGELDAAYKTAAAMSDGSR